MRKWWLLVIAGCAAPTVMPARPSPIGPVVPPPVVVVEPTWFDAVTDFHDGVAAVKRGAHWGYVDTHGAIIVPLELDAADPMSGAAWVMKDGALRAIDPTGKLSPPVVAEKHARFVGGRARVQIAGKWGAVDAGGVVVVPAKFDQLDTSGDTFLSGTIDGKRCELGRGATCVAEWTGLHVGHRSVLITHDPDRFGIIDDDGTVIAPPRFAQLVLRPDGSSWRREADAATWSLVDVHDKTLVAAGTIARIDLYDADGVAQVFTTTKLEGYIVPPGRLLGPYMMIGHKNFSEGLAPVGTAAGWGFVDRTGKVVIAPQFEEVNGFSGGLAGFRRGQMWGFIDRTGKVAIEPTFREIEAFVDGLAGVRSSEYSDHWGYIDRTGKLVVAADLSYGLPLDHGFATPRRGGQKVCVTRAAAVIPAPFDDVWGFHADRAKVSKADGTCGYVGPDCVLVTPLQYNSCDDFTDDGHAIADSTPERTDGCTGGGEGGCARIQERHVLIAKDGQVVIEADDILRRRDGLYIAAQGDQTALVAHGAIVFPMAAQDIDVTEGVVIVRRDDKSAFFHDDGTPLAVR